MPAYFQLARMLHREILRGGLLLGDRVPSENELSDEYGVSRMAARKAISLLTEKGMLRREKGRGTFVNSPRVEGGLFLIPDFRDEMRMQGLSSEVRLLGVRVVRAGKTAAAMLGISTLITMAYESVRETVLCFQREGLRERVKIVGHEVIYRIPTRVSRSGLLRDERSRSAARACAQQSRLPGSRRPAYGFSGRAQTFKARIFSARALPTSLPEKKETDLSIFSASSGSLSGVRASGVVPMSSQFFLTVARAMKSPTASARIFSISCASLFAKVPPPVASAPLPTHLGPKEPYRPYPLNPGI